MSKEEAQAQLNQHFEETDHRNVTQEEASKLEIEIPPHVEVLVQGIVKLTVMDSIKFSKRMAEVLGFDWDKIGAQGGMPGHGAAPAGAAPAAAAAPAEAEEAPAAEAEQTEFKITLEGFDPNKKIALIKEIKNLTGLGLKQAKELVEKSPIELKDKANREEADKFKDAIIAAGGDITIA